MAVSVQHKNTTSSGDRRRPCRHRGGVVRGGAAWERDVALLTTNCDTVGQMSCNPAIGGVAKGQIVREVDALGGLMGRAIDATGIQFRMLNRRKGPAMHSPRAQADKKAYQQEIKRLVEEQPNLTLRQEVVEDLLAEQVVCPKPAGGSSGGQPPRWSVYWCADGAVYRAGAVMLTTGTFLQALMHTGETKTPGGRAGEGTSAGIAARRAPCGWSFRARARFQDRHAATAEWPHDRLRSHRIAARGRRAAAVFVSHCCHFAAAAPLLDHVHQPARA